MTMDTDLGPEMVEPPTNCHQDVEIDKELKSILNFLTGIEEIVFKSQQRGEADLTEEEKFRIGVDIFTKSKLQFLLRFGDYLLLEHLVYFEKFSTENTVESSDILILIKNLSDRVATNTKSYNIKNRRYEALKELISEDKYFSEIEMMKRNPLLYEQLVGQYLTKEEIKERDRYNSEEGTSFVKILLDGIERDDAESKRKDQEQFENNAVEEEDSDSDEDMLVDERSRSPIQTRLLWGEFENEGKRQIPKIKNVQITTCEKKLLKEEFITTMYQSFLDGSDGDFDYKTVDSNAKYDSIETIEHDEEDKYFDSEEPADAFVDGEDVVSEDELDIYMSALNENVSVQDLSRDMAKVSTNQ